MNTSLGARVGSFDTDAFGVLLRMKSLVCQMLNNSFMLSSQPQAGVSKHPTRLLMPGCRSLSPWRRGISKAVCDTAPPLRAPDRASYTPD